jgi:endogenous inhibitor of DNA gyrase (YacG/DUF329 family)
MTEVKCPICDRPRDARYRPFCSKRCADKDLGNWLNETYTVPAGEAPDDEDEPATPPDETRYH